MDGGAAGMGGIKIEKLTETNFHEWRQRIKMILALRDLDDMIDEDGKPTDAEDGELAVWKRRDTKASAIIGFTLGSEKLEHVSGCRTTEELWSTLQGVFQRKSLMNKIKARREIYSVALNVGEGMLGCIKRVRNLGENLKATGGQVTEMDDAISVLSGLTSEYENLLVALDAEGEDELSLDFVNSSLLQVERRQADKLPAIKRIGDMALVGANYRGQGRCGDLSKIECYYCHKFGHISHDCPELKTKKQGQNKVAATAADYGCDSDDVICLVGNADDNDDISKSWLVDSAASAHMCCMRACLDDYKTTTRQSVTMGDKGSVATAGVGTVVLKVTVQGKTHKINLEKVLHVPSMGFNLMSVGMMEERGAEVSFKRGMSIILVCFQLVGERGKSDEYFVLHDPVLNYSEWQDWDLGYGDAHNSCARCRAGTKLSTTILKVGKKGTVRPARAFAEMRGALGVVASNDGFGAVSLQAECKGR